MHVRLSAFFHLPVSRSLAVGPKKQAGEKEERRGKQREDRRGREREEEGGETHRRRGLPSITLKDWPEDPVELLRSLNCGRRRDCVIEGKGRVVLSPKLLICTRNVWTEALTIVYLRKAQNRLHRKAPHLSSRPFTLLSGAGEGRNFCSQGKKKGKKLIIAPSSRNSPNTAVSLSSSEPWFLCVYRYIKGRLRERMLPGMFDVPRKREWITRQIRCP